MPFVAFPNVNRTLTHEQYEQYDRDGFVILKGLVSQRNLDRYRNRFQAICRGEVDSTGMTIMKDVSLKDARKAGEDIINKLQDFQEDPVLFEYCKLPEIIRTVQDLVGRNVLAIHTMLINKPPDPGTKTSRHPMHQDLHYFPYRPADRICCAWTAMEPVTRANGCLVAVPGSQKGVLLPHEYPKWETGVNKMYHGIQNYDPSQPRVYLEMEPGDTVFFHPLLIHGSGTNTTTGYRKAISCHYAAGECYTIDVRGTSQENIGNEVIALAKKRLGADIEVTYEDVWRIRSRVVAGESRL